MSDPRQQGRVRLTTAEPGAAEKPVQKPVAGASFVRAAKGGRPVLSTETFSDFTPVLAVDELEAVLNTAGFDGMEDRIAERLLVAVPELPVAVVAPIRETKPVASPAVEVYEPIEFLDYEDEQEEVASVPEPEPEPQVLVEPMAVPTPAPAAPAVAKMQAALGPMIVPDAAIEIPELTLRTAHARLVRGPNPNAPRIESRPVPAPSPLKAAAPAIARPPQPPVRPAAAAAAAATVASPLPVKSEPRPEVPKSNGQPDRDRRNAAKAPTPAAPAPATRMVRDRGNAVPVEEVVEQAPPAPKPKMVPIRKPEPPAPALSPAIAHDLPILGLEADRKTPAAKFGMIAVAVAVLAGGAYISLSGGKSSGNAARDEATFSEASSAGMVIGGGGWTTTWGADAPTNKGKQISIYRPSMAMPDYRLEFRGQIERKALGWIFRAQDPKNYYVMKLETIKSGANPIVALVKYAVVNGKETTRTQQMLPFQVSLDTVYLVRLDVKGDKFTTYVQGKALDYWSDDRIKLGGTGFYTDSGERSQIKSSQVSYLK